MNSVEEHETWRVPGAGFEKGREKQHFRETKRSMSEGKPSGAKEHVAIWELKGAHRAWSINCKGE